MMNLLNRGLYRRALKLWGHEAQMRQLQEEAAEVIVEVNHAIRTSNKAEEGMYRPENAMRLASEMADLEIMLEQMHQMGWTKLIEGCKTTKLERLEKRITKAEAELPVVLTKRVIDTAADNVPAEIEYTDPTGKVVGFFAYGHWDPGYPYQGQPDWSPES